MFLFDVKLVEIHCNSCMCEILCMSILLRQEIKGSNLLNGIMSTLLIRMERNIVHRFYMLIYYVDTVNIMFTE